MSDSPNDDSPNEVPQHDEPQNANPDDPRPRPAYGAYGPVVPQPSEPPAPAASSGPAAPSPMSPIWAGRDVTWKTDEPLTVRQAYRYAWAKFGSNAGTWIAAIIVVFAVDALVELALNPIVRTAVRGASASDVSDQLAQPLGAGDAALGAVAAALGFVVTAFLANGALASTRKARADMLDFFRLPNAGNVVALGLVLGAASFGLSFAGSAGTVLLVLVQFFLTYALFFVLDTRQDVARSIASSVRLVVRRPGIVILLAVAAVVVTLVGFFLCLVGLFVAVPLSYLAYAFGYRRITDDGPS